MSLYVSVFSTTFWFPGDTKGVIYIYINSNIFPTYIYTENSEKIKSCKYFQIILSIQSATQSYENNFIYDTHVIYIYMYVCVFDIYM